MSNGLKYVKLAHAVPHVVSYVTPQGQQVPASHSYFSVTCEYLNGFSKTVTIVDRDGLKVEICPSLNPQVRDFTIRYRLTLGRDVNLNIDALLSSEAPSAVVLAQVVQEGSVSVHFSQKVYSLDYHISLEEIETRGGSLYLTTLDRVISTLTGHLVPHHPLSEVYLRNVAVETNPDVNNVDSFGYSIKIYDTLGQYGERYVNINQQAYRIPVIANSILPDGVYLTSSGAVTGNTPFPKPISKRFNFEEADTILRLYKTVETALAFGDEFAEKEKALKEMAIQQKEREYALKQEKIQREMEFETFKQNVERQRLEEDAIRKQEEARMASKLSQLKEEISQLEHQRTLEMLQKKDHYEYRSLERKESSEVVKFLPTIITGALAIFLAVSKFN